MGAYKKSRSGVKVWSVAHPWALVLVVGLECQGIAVIGKFKGFFYWV